MDFENRLQKHSAEFTENDRKIAEHLLNVKNIEQKSITDLADEIDVSPSSITRFCKKIQFATFQQMKYALLATRTEKRSNDEEVERVANFYHSIIASTQQFMDTEQTERIANDLISAKRVLFCGIGNSGLIAKEFNSRIERMGIDSAAVTDAHSMVMKSALLHEEDVFMCFSYTGKTQSVLDATRQAKDCGARIIVITTNDSEALTELADEVVLVSNHVFVDDEKFINTQISSLFYLDVLTYRLLEDAKLMEQRNKTLNALRRFG
ncbi:MurR/RpiR family transcriptional regulator [Sporosarcina gallistercoris]|uniref:MurR/RpiR family transcriptional regulator n=1 Tax=Sporosarcina gallistercoris TaxID=2762245 RepID=A0ABR8PM93_9BACL|nr:MurR/RpiR family transcriptional regulator [Sporosarcina gallistercoris]MBD7909296.1 MurR/RpiR family transcriptional regulator [Sporosarcina gallistercoris]